MVVSVISIIGCGQTAKETNVAGSLAPADKNPGGGALYQKYKSQFPSNLMELSAQDYMKKWPNTGYLIQSSDGSEQITVYSTAQVFKDVMDSVDEAYPSVNEEDWVNEQARQILEAHKVGNDATENVSEEEATKELQERYKDWQLRIAAEKRYMTVGELTSPEVQNQIAAQVANVQQSILDDSANDIKNPLDHTQILFTDKQTELLIYSCIMA